MATVFIKDDKTEFTLKAYQLFNDACSMSNLGDSKHYKMWYKFVPHADVIHKFWPYITPLFDKEELKYKDFKAIVVYYYENGLYCSEPNNPEDIKFTGIYLEFITPSERHDIEEETENLAKLYNNTCKPEDAIPLKSKD